MSWKRRLLVLCCVLVVSSRCWALEIGSAVPDFTVQTFEGATVSRASLEGKPFLLVFWNTWCANCLRELPEIARQHERLGPKGLVVLAVNTALNDTEQKARAYWKRQGYGFPCAFDRDYDVMRAFNIFGVPTVFLVDSKGIVRYKQAGSPRDLEERLTQLGGSE